MKQQQYLFPAELAKLLGSNNWTKSHHRFEAQLPSGITLVIVSDLISGELSFFTQQEVADYTQAGYKAGKENNA
jgi:hypothetical protein